MNPIAEREPILATPLQRFAAAFVALAANEEQQAKINAALARKALAGVSEKYQKQIEQHWEAANKKALRLLVLVMENNPKKTPEQILNRPDVRAVLRQPYVEAATKSEALLKQAWDEAETLSIKHAKSEAKSLNTNWNGHQTDPALRAALIKDLHRNAKAMRSRYRDALSDRENAARRLKSIASDGALRARYSTQAAVWGVAAQVHDSAAARAGLNKMWVAVLDDATCTHCAAQHGRVIGPGEQFPLNAGATALAAYQGVLYGPPRHPNCRCVLVLTKLQKSKDKF